VKESSTGNGSYNKILHRKGRGESKSNRGQREREDGREAEVFSEETRSMKKNTHKKTKKHPQRRAKRKGRPHLQKTKA